MIYYEGSKDEDIEIDLFVLGIEKKYSYDFSQYSHASRKRRIVAAVNKFRCESIMNLLQRALNSEEFFHEMLAVLTVPVTEMFRDPEFYRQLRALIVPYLHTYPSIKIWNAGCATGEEAYSIAILLAEEGLLGKSTIFATDISKEALARAKDGIYMNDRMRLYSDNYHLADGIGTFSDYYLSQYGASVMRPELRDKINFCEHNLVSDEVFSEFHLVLCRNVLIYFQKNLQERVLGLFQESLIWQGFLCLGSKESIKYASCSDAFKALSESNRIYQKC